MQAQIDQLLTEMSVPNPIWEVFSETVSLLDKDLLNYPIKELQDANDSLIRWKDGSGCPRSNLQDMDVHSQS